MADEEWVRKTEREMGSVFERLRSVENADAALRTELREGFAKQERALADGMRNVGESVLRESAHTRGEISRLDSLMQENRRNDEAAAQRRQREEETRNAELIATLKKQAAEAETAVKATANKNRPFVVVAILLGLAAQWLLENYNAISNLMEGVPR